MAQQTKKGNVYIISNVGSFGEDVFEVGMTRRLDPMDRVKELGNAAVPFSFDVHAIIASDDAPALEHAIHDASRCSLCITATLHEQGNPYGKNRIVRLPHGKGIHPGGSIGRFVSFDESLHASHIVPPS